MKPSHVLVRIIAVAALVAPAVPARAQSVALRYGWTKGESRSYRITTQTDRTISGMPGAPPGPVTVSQTVTQVMTFVAEEVAPDGAVTLRQTFQSFRMENSNPMGKFVFDSAAPAASQDPMAQNMRETVGAMIGESVLIEMAADGVVRRVDGPSRIAEKIARVVATNPEAAAASQALRTSLGNEAFKTTLEQTFPRLSAPPVKPGDTWTGQLAMGNPAMGRIAGRTVFTLKALEGGGDAAVARIAVVLTLKQEVVPPPNGPAAMVITLGEAKGAGEIVFGLKGGRIQRSTMRTDVPSTVVMNGPDGAPATVDNKTTITMTMELVEK